MKVISLSEARRQRPFSHRPMRAQLRPSAAFGLEALDLMGIDIDQDPRAFAKFLELKNRLQAEGLELQGQDRRMARHTR